MTEEKQKIGIVIGAGASADFVLSEDKKLNEKHGDIKYEIWENTQYHFDKNPDKNSRYFLSENNRKNYSFPSGEALIKMIGNPRKVFDFFGNKILDEINKDFCKKVDWSIEGEDQNIIELKKNFLKYFFEFLKNPIYQNQQEKNVNIFSFDKSTGHAIEKYVSEIGAITNDYCYFKNILKRIEKFNKNLEFYNFINIYNSYFGISEYKNEMQDQIISLVTDFLEVTLRKNLKIEISQSEDLEY